MSQRCPVLRYITWYLLEVLYVDGSDFMVQVTKPVNTR
jgi:hypothetical protein